MCVCVCVFVFVFVFDLFDVRKTRFSHVEAHMSKIIQCNYSYLA